MRNVIKGFTFNTGRTSRHATPAARLALFRGLSASYAGGDWRKAREAMHAPESRPLWPGFNSRNSGTKHETRRPVMVTHSGEQFKGEQWADEAEGVRIDHRGWFSDADCSRTLRAFVFPLSRGRFGCGYADSDSGERVYYPCVFDEVRDAASFADSEAQYYAEAEKEHNERWHAARELRDEIAEKAKEVKRLYVLRNSAVDDDVRDELAEAVDELRTMRKKLANDYADIDE